MFEWKESTQITEHGFSFCPIISINQIICSALWSKSYLEKNGALYLHCAKGWGNVFGNFLCNVKCSYHTSVKIWSFSTAKQFLTSRWQFASVFYEIFFSLHKGMCIIEKDFFFIKHATLNFHIGDDIFSGVSSSSCAIMNKKLKQRLCSLALNLMNEPTHHSTYTLPYLQVQV